MQCLLGLKFLDAIGTYVFALEIYDILGVVAEDTGRLIFFQDDRSAVHINLQRILLSNVQCAAQFDGEHDTAQFIYFSYDTRRFHMCILPFSATTMFFHDYLETDIIITCGIPMSIIFLLF